MRFSIATIAAVATIFVGTQAAPQHGHAGLEHGHHFGHDEHGPRGLEGDFDHKHLQGHGHGHHGVSAFDIFASCFNSS